MAIARVLLSGAAAPLQRIGQLLAVAGFRFAFELRSPAARSGPLGRCGIKKTAGSYRLPALGIGIWGSPPCTTRAKVSRTHP